MANYETVLIDQSTGYQVNGTASKLTKRYHATNTTSQNINATTETTIDFDGVNIDDGIAVNASGVYTIQEDGEYEIGYNVVHSNGNNGRKTPKCAIYLNGTELGYTRTYSYNRNGTNDLASQSCPATWVNCNSGDTVEVRGVRYQGGGTGDTVIGQCFIYIKKLP